MGDSSFASEGGERVRDVEEWQPTEMREQCRGEAKSGYQGCGHLLTAGQRVAVQDEEGAPVRHKPADVHQRVVEGGENEVTVAAVAQYLE